jgi:hypothetical protein
MAGGEGLEEVRAVSGTDGKARGHADPHESHQEEYRQCPQMGPSVSRVSTGVRLVSRWRFQKSGGRVHWADLAVQGHKPPVYIHPGYTTGGHQPSSQPENGT